MNQAASRAFLGESVTIRGSYEAVWHCGWRSIGLSLVEFIAIWVLPFAAWFVLLLFSAGLAAVAQSAGVGGGGLFALAAVLVVIGLVAYAFWIAIRISLAFPAFIVERSGVWDALRRSSLLTTGTRGRILVLYLLGAALNWILSIAITLPLTIVMAMLPGASSPQHAQATAVASLCVVYGAAFAVQALTRPVYGIALMLFYYDQRIRQEGFDIEWMMMKAGLVVPRQQQPAGELRWTTPSGVVDPSVSDAAPNGSEQDRAVTISETELAPPPPAHTPDGDLHVR